MIARAAHATVLHLQAQKCHVVAVLQAFQEELLAACGRSHALADVEDALAAVTAAAPRSWSLDLISGLRPVQEVCCTIARHALPRGALLSWRLSLGTHS
jgi:hypothetical protein